MNGIEQVLVAQVLAKADGGCPYCVTLLIAEANKVLPGYNWRKLVLAVDPHVLDFPDPEEVLKQIEGVQSEC